MIKMNRFLVFLLSLVQTIVISYGSPILPNFGVVHDFTYNDSIKGDLVTFEQEIECHYLIITNPKEQSEWGKYSHFLSLVYANDGTVYINGLFLFPYKTHYYCNNINIDPIFGEYEPVNKDFHKMNYYNSWLKGYLSPSGKHIYFPSLIYSGDNPIDSLLDGKRRTIKFKKFERRENSKENFISFSVNNDGTLSLDNLIYSDITYVEYDMD